MKNALILHGTDFGNDKTQHLNNWFPWLKTELEKLSYQVWLEELPDAIYPNLEKYWDVLKDFNYNSETIIIGHSSGGTAVFGLLNKLPVEKKIKLAISVAGFYKDQGFNSTGLLNDKFNWEKIKKQTEKVILIASDNDSYVKPFQAQYFAEELEIEPIIMSGYGHFSLGSDSKFKQFPELLEIVKNNA